MKKFKHLILSALVLCLAFAFASCGGSVEWTALTTDNAESYFDIDYGVDIVKKTEEDSFVTEGQFYVNAAEKKTEYNLKNAELTVQVTYDVKTSISSLTKTKQITLSVSDLAGNDMEMFFDTYKDSSEYPEISIKSVEISAIKGSVKA